MFLSHGHVSSKMMAVRVISLKMKTSGLRDVTRIWGGTVPPCVGVFQIRDMVSDGAGCKIGVVV